jgi:hypothetical protein
MGSRAEPLPDRLFVEVLFMLLVSNGRLDLRWLNVVGSAGDSFGDSYARGIAGTGGTSSSSLLPAELCTGLAFGAGNLDDEGGGGNLGCSSDPVEVRAGLKLAVDPVESREPKDLRLMSGVMLTDDGVGVFLGSADGERDAVRIVEESGWGVGGVCGIGGAFCNEGAPCKTDNRFALLASVGLTVLAPSPVACEPWPIPCITDIRFAEEDGVFMPWPGDLLANEEDLLCSGVPTPKFACPCIAGG